MSSIRHVSFSKDKSQPGKEFHKFIPFAGNSRVGIMTEKHRTFLVHLQGVQPVNTFDLSRELCKTDPTFYRLTAFHDNQHILLWDYKKFWLPDREWHETSFLYKINVINGELIAKYKINDGAISHIVIATDDKRLFMRYEQGIIKTCQLENDITCIAMGNMQRDDEYGNIFIVLPDEQHFLTVTKYATPSPSKPGGVKMWELPKNISNENLNCQQSNYLGDTSYYTALYINECNQLLIAGNNLAEISIFDINKIDNPQLIVKFTTFIETSQATCFTSTTAGMKAFAITPDNKYLVSRHQIKIGHRNILWNISNISQPKMITHMDKQDDFYEDPITLFITNDWKVVTQRNTTLNFLALETAFHEYTIEKEQILSHLSTSVLPIPDLNNEIFSYLYGPTFFKSATRTIETVEDKHNVMKNNM